MSEQPLALRLADLIEGGWTRENGQATAAELRRLHEVNQELLGTLQTVLNISLMDKGHWSKTIEQEAHAAIAKATSTGETV